MEDHEEIDIFNEGPWNAPVISYIGKCDSHRCYARGFGTIRSAAQDECHFCAILERVVLEYLEAATPELIVMAHLLQNTRNNSTVYIRVYVYPPGSYQPLRRDDFYAGTLVASWEDVGPALLEEANSTFYTGSDANLRLIASWIRECVEKHDKCNESLPSVRSSPNKMRLPAYIVELSVQNGRLSARLIDPGTLDVPPKWVTLSHCWGKAALYCTTRNNLDEHKTCIPFSKLSKTFRDAMDVAVRLGHHYIWIDSLCIIQDSEAHWHQECEVMADIYSNSVFTIAASGASDGSGGCYRTRNPWALIPLRLDIRCAPGIMFLQGGFYVQWMQDRDGWLHHEHLDWTTGRNQYKRPAEPLETRAWVLQERLLSPRTVYFGLHTISYECRTTNGFSRPTRAAARSVHGLSDLRPTFKGYFYWLNRPDTEIPTNYKRRGQINSTLVDLRQVYYRVVEHYSRLHLSYRTDKLVAIQGLLHRQSLNLPFTFLAGLCRETFVADLIWYRLPSDVGGGLLPIDPGRPYTAPTWSWASVDGPVRLDLPSSEFEEQILQQLHGDNPWHTQLLDAKVLGRKGSGMISGGWARLKGPLTRVLAAGEDNMSKAAAHLSPAWRSPEMRAKYKQFSTQLYEDLRSPVHDNSHEIWALLLGVLKTKWTVFNPEREIVCATGLLVRKNGRLASDGLEEYIRVGLFEVPVDDAAQLHMLWQNGSERVVHLV